MPKAGEILHVGCESDEGFNAALAHDHCNVPPLVIGPAVTALGFLALGVTAADASYWTGVLPGVVVMSFGMTIAVAPLTTTVLNAVPEDLSGVASGINNAAARAGSLVAVAALGLIVGDAANPLLTRELVYTGVSRARRHARLWALPDVLRAAVARATRRDGGLRERLRRGR